MLYLKSRKRAYEDDLLVCFSQHHCFTASETLLSILAELFKISSFSSSLIPMGQLIYSHVLFLSF